MQVASIADALVAIARYQRSLFKGKVLAITGSVGKTTTKQACAALLRQNADTVATQGNQNNELGVPITLSRFDAQRYAVIELGVGKPNDMPFIAKLTRPDIAVITNIGQAHLAYFKTQKAIAEEKSRLLDCVASGGVAVLNRDDAFFSLLEKRAQALSVLSFGSHAHADVRISAVQELGFSGSRFCLHYANKEYLIATGLLGAHVPYNLACAFAVAVALNLDLAKSAQCLSQLQAFVGRMQLIRTQRFSIINDSYNASPESMQQALRFLLYLLAKDASISHAIALLGDMRELGEQSAQLHIDLGLWLKNQRANNLQIWAVGQQAKLLAVASGLPYLYFNHVADLEQCFSASVSCLQQDYYAVLIKGSNATGVMRALPLFNLC